MNEEIMATRLLLVEGQDEVNFFKALTKHLDITNIQIFDLAGNRRLGTGLRTLTVLPNFDTVTKIGIVRDADDNPKSTFQSIRDTIANSPLVSPNKPLEPSDGFPSVSVMIMPDAESSGMLEDLCLQAVAEDEMFDCVAQLFDCIEANQNLSLPRNISKAKMQAFLSTQDRYIGSVGLAAFRHIWSWEHPVFNEVIDFLHNLTSD